MDIDQQLKEYKYQTCPICLGSKENNYGYRTNDPYCESEPAYYKQATTHKCKCCNGSGIVERYM